MGDEWLGGNSSPFRGGSSPVLLSRVVEFGFLVQETFGNGSLGYGGILGVVLVDQLRLFHDFDSVSLRILR